MVRHIVLWRLKESSQGRSKAENARLIKQKLESLRGIIPGLSSIEVGIDFSRTEQSFDVALCAMFESRKALEDYQSHPAHQAAVAFIREARVERCIADYEL